MLISVSNFVQVQERPYSTEVMMVSIGLAGRGGVR